MLIFLNASGSQYLCLVSKAKKKCFFSWLLPANLLLFSAAPHGKTILTAVDHVEGPKVVKIIKQAQKAMQRLGGLRMSLSCLIKALLTVAMTLCLPSDGHLPRSQLTNYLRAGAY